MLFGSINDKFTGFVQEVTPHEVAHQWWGHAVGWASYHDQWLSEGFAEFSAGLFLQQGVAGDWRKDYIEFWDRLRQRILEKNNFGIAPNDAGPLWMGLRLISPRTENAYQNVTYPKGAYVLQMLRSMMYDPDDQDKAFIAMMHDFVESHREQAATTESFKAIAEKHMTKMMDLGRNGRLDWFFDEWVYGTQVPRYHFEYQLSPGGRRQSEAAYDDHPERGRRALCHAGSGICRLRQRHGPSRPTRNRRQCTRRVDVMLPSQPKKVGVERIQRNSGTMSISRDSGPPGYLNPRFF